MDFQPQFVLLYFYDAVSLRPLYYRMLPGNIREISAMKNTIKNQLAWNIVPILQIKAFFLKPMFQSWSVWECNT